MVGEHPAWNSRDRGANGEQMRTHWLLVRNQASLHGVVPSVENLLHLCVSAQESNFFRKDPGRVVLRHDRRQVVHFISRNSRSERTVFTPFGSGKGSGTCNYHGRRAAASPFSCTILMFAKANQLFRRCDVGVKTSLRLIFLKAAVPPSV